MTHFNGMAEQERPPEAVASNPLVAGNNLLQAVLRFSEIHARGLIDLNDEVTRFAERRIESNRGVLRGIDDCRTARQALDVQRAWLRTASEQYAEQFRRLLLLNTEIAEGTLGAIGLALDGAGAHPSGKPDS